MKNTQRQRFAFTVPEVLVVVAIIGITAAITIPIISKDYKEKTYNSARLKALATFGEAGKMAALYDYDKPQTSAKNFVNNILSKNLKVMRVCDTAEECNFPSAIMPSNSDIKEIKSINIVKWNQIGNNPTAVSSPTNDANMSTYIESVGGYSAKVFYNPKCGKNSKQVTNVGSACTEYECPSYAVDQACMNVIYDMNGTKGPNQVGYDIGFVTTFWSGANTISVAPGILPYGIAKAIFDKDAKTWTEAQNLCAENSTSKVQYTLPSIEELQSMALNRNLIPLTNESAWSGSVVAEKPGYVWGASGNSGTSGHIAVDATRRVWCVRR